MAGHFPQEHLRGHRGHLRHISKLVLCLAFLSSLAFGRTYTSPCAGTENPISEGGNWINGGTTGLGWTNVRKTPGLCFGTMPGNATGNAQFADSTATVSGPWGPDQDVSGTVAVISATTNSSVFEEVEVRLRTTITANSITGYEVNCSIANNGGVGNYMQLIKWTGPLAGFTQLNGWAQHCVQGDVIRATISGTTSTSISVFRNGTLVGTTVDSSSPWLTGAPGMGFYLQGATGLAANYGLSNFSATDNIPTKLWSNIMADSRGIDWSGAGVVGGIPSGSWTQCGATIAAGASATTINVAIAACGANQYVLLGSGTFNLNNGLLWNSKSGVALRGQGPELTSLIFTGVQSCSGSPNAPICFMSSDLNYFGSPSNVANWTAGYVRLATSITLSSLTVGSHPPTVGEFLTVDQTDDVCGTITSGHCAGDTNAIFICYLPIGQCSGNGDNGGAPRAGRSQQQIVTITSVSGTGPYTVGISPGLAMSNWAAGKTPQAWWATNPVHDVGIENVSIDATGAGGHDVVTFFNVRNGWVKGIRSIGPTIRSHVVAWQSAHITVQDSYFYKTNDNASVNYGFESLPASDMLVQNNIFEQIQAPYPANGSCTGCVFAYNFDVNNNFCCTTQFQNQSGFAHAVGDDFMLYEGNIGSGFASDNFHGTHHLITNFRNYWNGYQLNEGVLTTQANNPLIMKAYSRFYNAIGNVLGNPAKHTTYSTLYDIGSGAGIPADPQTGLTLMRWGNYANCSGASPCNTSNFDSTEVPSGLTGNQAPWANPVPIQTLPSSFYLPAQPSWWTAGKAFPPIGPDVVGGNVKYCTGGAMSGTYVLVAGQCPGGSVSTLAGGRIISNPAMDCYLNSMSGPPDGQGAVLLFSPTTCYSPSGQPTIDISPTGINYPLTLVGTQSATQPFTITNTSTGVAVLTIASVQIPAQYFQGGGTCVVPGTLQPGISCTVQVGFAPTQSGTVNGLFCVTDNAIASPQCLNVSGTGAPTTVSFTPNPLAFGSQAIGSQSAPQSATLTNTGTGVLSLNCAGCGLGITNSAIFSFVDTTCGTSLAPGASCVDRIAFSPPNNGSFTGTLTYTTNAVNSPSVITMTGTGGVSKWRLGRLGTGAMRWARNAGLPTANVYSARTDQCETSGTGSEPGCTGQPAMSFLGRLSNASGVFTTIDTPPTLNNGTTLDGMNAAAIDPDFHTKISRVTDYTHMSALGLSFSLGAGGDVQIWAKDSSSFMVVNSGGIYRLFAFDGVNMVSTPTSLGGNGAANCAGATYFGTGCTNFVTGNVSFSSTDPSKIYEMDVSLAPTHLYLNQLLLDKSTGNPATWTMTRSLLYDFATSTHCMPSDFNTNYVGSFNISSDDNVFAFAFSDHGQNGIRDGTHPYGATFVAVFDKRHPNGCRVLKTFPASVGTPMQIDGDWGPTGSVLMGTDKQATDCQPDNPNQAPACYPNSMLEGVSQGPTLLDSFYLHNAGPTANNKYVVMSGSDILACTTVGTAPARSTCYCKNGANTNLCEAYTWEQDTLNIRPNKPAGHNVKGSLGSYKGSKYSFYTYHDPYLKLSDLLSINIPVDQHGTPGNLDSSDHQPIAFVSSNICGQGSGAGAPDCDTSYGLTGNNAYYDEFVMVENQAGASFLHGGDPTSAQHCSGPSACAYRMAHTFNTGSHWNFGVGNAISNISPDGQFALMGTDWFGNFGCTNGWNGKSIGQLCLNNLDANGKGAGTAITSAVESPSGNGKGVTFTSTMNPTQGAIITVSGFVSETRWNKDWTVLTTGATSWTAQATVTGLATENPVAGLGRWDCGNGAIASTPCPRGDVVVINLRTAGTVH